MNCIGLLVNGNILISHIEQLKKKIKIWKYN
jgi:hypothetical protein